MTMKEMFFQAEKNIYNHYDYQKWTEFFNGSGGLKVVAIVAVFLILLGIALLIKNRINEEETTLYEVIVFFTLSVCVIGILKVTNEILLYANYIFVFPIELFVVTGAWQIIATYIVFLISIIVFIIAFVISFFAEKDIMDSGIFTYNFLIGIGLEILFLSIYFIPRISY